MKPIQLNVKKIIAVANTTFAVAKRKPEKKFRLVRDRTLDLCDTSAALEPTELTNQLGLAIWLATKLKPLFQNCSRGNVNLRKSLNSFFISVCYLVVPTPTVCPQKTTTGKCCSIPFKYQGKTYNACTKVNHNRPWCSLDPVYKGRWGNCREYLPGVPCQAHFLLLL